jgi:ribonucleoside-diphosphate reductase alpha chain
VVDPSRDVEQLVHSERVNADGGVPAENARVRAVGAPAGAEFATGISRLIWDTKYRFRTDGQIHDVTLTDTWRRIANALARAERAPHWEARFYRALAGFKFLPAGRIQAGAGTGRRVTLFNCFVMGTIEDSLDGIFDAIKEGALTMQQGGGVGYDFSTLRPQGTAAKAVGSVASGPVSFMRIWDATCATLLSTGARRGAMMATLRCDHPDIETFIRAKRAPGELRNFNLSVLVSDDFMRAIEADAEWPLVFPEEGGAGESLLRRWSGGAAPVPCRIHRRVPARKLWDELMRATYDYAEPGVLFIDRINRLNNLRYCEQISATNPCSEIPLPPYGACDLGSINLTAFVGQPFTANASLDLEAISEVAAVAVRMLDDVIEVSRFPLPQQERMARGTRRIGLGITGLADVLIMLGLHYGSQPARELAAGVMRAICHAAYRCSVELAREKGPFPFFDRERYLEGEFICALPADVRDGIARHGIRNSHLTAIAPTGTISLLANNVSSGIEPVYDFRYRRRVLELDGEAHKHELTDHVLDRWRAACGDAPLPAAFVRAHELPPAAHLDMQAALQPYIDNAISKTINVPADFAFQSFKDVYRYAFEHGLKGCTTYRPNVVTGAVLEVAAEEAKLCCVPDREAD